MKKQKGNFCLNFGAGLSLLLHGCIALALFWSIEQAPEPGGSGLLMDAFLTGGGDGFYQSGVPWGDLNYRAGSIGSKVSQNAQSDNGITEEKSEVQSNAKPILDKKIKSDGAALVAKKSTVKKKKVAKRTKSVKKTANTSSGTGTQPYGGVVGDAPGFGAGSGTGIGIGTGSGVGNVKAAKYFVRIRRIFQRNLKYPDALENKKTNGKVVVRFSVDANGLILPQSVITVQSSGEPILDNHAVKTVLDVKKLPEPPFGAMTIEIPVVFRVYR